MRDALDIQTQAYEALLPDIRKKYGSVWALVVNERLVKTFKEFSQAAQYVVDHHIKEQVLISHTDEPKETAPFIRIED